ncbi:hypothetical protein ADUPG1_012397 [Aduncisulcus paluster]|uniref:VWFA domain-containing protein n=1 Tax=Aduncisulcus paluster TaxID=2918883 RepID=A0ABQ5JZB6_9EUKA|nr:hypothetical protein ADUPG1_012397 [Aduncisulcus paluster]
MAMKETCISQFFLIFIPIVCFFFCVAPTQCLDEDSSTYLTLQNYAELVNMWSEFYDLFYPSSNTEIFSELLQSVSSSSSYGNQFTDDVSETIDSMFNSIFQNIAEFSKEFTQALQEEASITLPLASQSLDDDLISTSTDEADLLKKYQYVNEDDEDETLPLTFETPTLWCPYFTSETCNEDKQVSQTMIDAFRNVYFCDRGSYDCNMEYVVDQDGNVDTAVSPLLWIRRVFTDGAVTLFPGVNFFHPISSSSLLSRSTLDPRSSITYDVGRNMGIRRGIVLIIDIETDPVIDIALADEDVAAAAIAQMSDTVNIILSHLTSTDYVAILSTDEAFDARLEFTATSNGGDKRGCDDELEGGLVSMTSAAVNLLMDEVTDYFDNLSGEELMARDHLSPFSSSALSADAPLVVALSKAYVLLRGALDPSVSLETVLSERVASPVGFSSSQASLTPLRPLPSSSPLHVITVSLGAAVPAHLELHLTSDREKVSNAHVSTLFFRSTLADDILNNTLMLNSDGLSSSDVMASRATENILHSVSCRLNGSIDSIDFSGYYDLYMASDISDDDDTSDSVTTQGRFVYTDYSELLKPVERIFEQKLAMRAFELFRQFGPFDCAQGDEAVCSNEEVANKMLWEIVSIEKDPILESNIVSLASPVFINDRFDSVILIDISLQWMLDHVIDADGVGIDSNYSFPMLFDRQKTLLLHPALVNIGLTNEGVDLDLLEQFDSDYVDDNPLTTGGSDFSSSVLYTVVNRSVNTGELSVPVLRHMVADFTELTPVETTYGWQKLDTEFIVVTSLQQLDIDKIHIPPPESSCSDISDDSLCYNASVWGQISLANSDYQADIGYAAITDHFLLTGVTASLTTPFVHLSEECFTDSTLFTSDFSSSTLDSSSLFESITAELSGESDSTYVTEACIDAAKMISIFDDHVVSTAVDEETTQKYVLSSFRATPEGVLSLFPGTSFSEVPQPKEFTWYGNSLTNAMAGDNTLFVSLPVTSPDTNISQFSISKAKVVNGTPTMVSGLNIHFPTIKSFLYEGLCGSDSTVTCFLLNTNGNLLFSSRDSEIDTLEMAVTMNEEVFIGESNPAIFTLLESLGVLKSKSAFNISSGVIDEYFTTDTSSLTSSVDYTIDGVTCSMLYLQSTLPETCVGYESADKSTVTIVSITDTNLLGVIVINYPSSDDCETYTPSSSSFQQNYDGCDVEMSTNDISHLWDAYDIPIPLQTFTMHSEEDCHFSQIYPKQDMILGWGLVLTIGIVLFFMVIKFVAM